jgi:hypothetical protein
MEGTQRAHGSSKQKWMIFTCCWCVSFTC